MEKLFKEFFGKHTELEVIEMVLGWEYCRFETLRKSIRITEKESIKMEAVLEKYKYLFRTPRPDTWMERVVFDEKVMLLQTCSKYCQTMQREPLDETYIEMLTEHIYKRIKIINSVEHYLDTRYSR